MSCYFDIAPQLRRVRRQLGRGALVLATTVLLAAPAPLLAQPPEDGRPYLELPFLGDTDYEVTCGYGCYQHHGSMHYAVDFAIPEGDPILAAAPGEVMAVTWEVGLPVSLDLGDALIVYIDHGGGWFTRYVHLSGVTVRVGDQVAMGDVIGYSGKTGASGDHLHFELKYGDSLHSPSVPIDELFTGDEPIAGESYLSNNYRQATLREVLLPELLPTPTLEATLGLTPEATIPGKPPTTTAQPTPLPTPDTPQAAAAWASYLPHVPEGLQLSATSAHVNDAVVASFTLHNRSSERMHLGMLGVGSRPVGAQGYADASLLFDRAIILNPGRSYHWQEELRFAEPGDYELFLFALGEENEWLPLEGAQQSLILHIDAPVMSNHIFLPTLQNNHLFVTDAADQEGAQPHDAHQ